MNPLPDSGPPSRLRVAMRRAARVAWVGALVGTLVASIGQVVVKVGANASRQDPGWGQRLVGATLIGAAYGCALALACGLLVLLLGGPHSTGPALTRRERAVLYVVSTFGSVAILLHLFGVALRVFTGSHLTFTGLEYFWNSGSHIANEVVNRYLSALVVLAVLGFVIGFALSRGLRWALCRGGELSRSELGAAVALPVAWALFAVVPVSQSFGLGLRQTEPELAFAASLPSARSSSELGAEERILLARALEAPPQSRLDGWRAVAPASGVRPNVVLVTVEAINVHHLGYEGYPRAVTPNLDRLAGESLRAERAYTTATHSNYAQMAIISSLFPRRGSTLDMYFKLDYPRVLLHDVTSELGYATATISSQDENWQGMKLFEDTGTPTYFFHSPDETGRHLDIGTEEVVPDEVTIDHVLEYVDRQRAGENGGAPFSVYVNLQSTHFPYAIPENAPRPFTPYEPKGNFSFVAYGADDLDAVVNRYDNALHYIDAQVGRLVDGLAARGLDQDTILVFVADHGEMFREHDLVTHARSLYEGEARVPILVRYPAGLEPGVVSTPVSTLDILPTVLDLMEVPPHPAMQGESFLGDRAPPGEALVKAHDARPAIFLNIQGWKHLEAVVCYPNKLIYDPESDASQLFDVARDPGELRDLVAEQPTLAASLLDVLHAQIRAQLEFHEGDAHLSKTHFAPRLLHCPARSGLEAASN